MIFDPIITEFDDQDAYKFFMQYAVLKHYPNAKVKYKFILRDKTRKFPKGFDIELREQIDHFKTLRFTQEMEDHMKSKLPFFDVQYYSYLKSYRYNPKEVEFELKDGELELEIGGNCGYWHTTIYWEVQLMALISELFFLFTGSKIDLEKTVESWEEKYRALDKLNVTISEFGTRRRYSKYIQGLAIEKFLEIAPKTIVGTSNVMFARKYNIKAIGTQAHEWYMFHGAKYGVMMANRVGLGRWVDTYQGSLGIALPDTYTTDIFFEGFDLFYSKLFDGTRQDSGCPIEFAEKAINHYVDKKIVLPNGLIPKTIVFSDSINSVVKIESIEEVVKDKIFSAYGIGTWMSNDVILYNEPLLQIEIRKAKPMNMVIKMSEALPEGMTKWRNCVKLSDSKGKYTGDVRTVDLYTEELGI